MEDPNVRISMLPSDVILEILTWLPVKPLLKFRCVCKSWRALISSKRFVNAHLKNSKLDRNFSSCRLVMGCGGNLKQCSVNSLQYEPVCEAFDMSYPVQAEEIRLIGSCNGLICLSMYGKELILWNPSTRACKKLPVHGLNLKVRKDVEYGFGFGFDKSGDDYKVVVHFNGKPGFSGEIMQVYSLRDDQWKMIDNFVADDWLMYDHATFVNGSLYWIAFALYDSKSFWEIVSFNLETEEGGIPQLPSYVKRCKYATLGASEGSLFVLCSHSTSADVWIMNGGCSVGDKKWTKMVTIPYTSDSLDYTYKRALCVKNGEVLFLFFRDRGHTFVIFDAKDCSISYPEVRTKFSRLQSYFTGDLFQLGTYVESLVSPLG